MLAPTLFVTGMQRSGTTLVEKLLAGHGEISMLSQPFPFLFLDVMRSFFRWRGLPAPAYPLGTLFRQRAYRPEDLAQFLAAHVVDAEAVASSFRGMEGFSGQYTRFPERQLQAALAELAPGDLASVVAQLYRLLAPAPQAPWCGGKETSCEELAPFLLSRGIRVLLVLRDPRDVLASLNHGRGERYAGRPKPTLFNIRQWRKSVAFALHLEPDPGFLALRYEDLVRRPGPTLQRIVDWLGCAPFSRRDGEPLRDASGTAWTGNSSHGRFEGLSTSSVGRYHQVLPPEVVALVESCCRPELDRLGYRRELPETDPWPLIRSFREPYAMTRPELAEHLPSPQNAADEQERLASIESERDAPAPDLLLFADVAARLRESEPAR